MYAIIDIESSGGKFNQEHIIEIAIFIFDGKSITKQYQTLVKAPVKIDPYVSRMTKITDQMLVDKPVFKDIQKQIFDITKDKIIVAHNVKFDYRMLRLEFGRISIEYERETIDTIELAKKKYPNLPSFGMKRVCEFLNIEIKNRHRAHGDALALVEVFKDLLK